MIAKLTGRVDSTGDAKGEGWAVIDVGGVGYMVFCSNRTLSALAGEAGMVSLFIETHVREDHIHLYGFADVVEREWYRLTTTVQGVGSKVALAILSVLPADQLAQVVAAQDVAALTQAPGVGKKLATRIVAELKDKVGDLALGSAAAGSPDRLQAIAGGDMEKSASDAVSALVNLGYGRSEAFGAVSQVARRLGADAAVEALIRDGLTELAHTELRGQA